MTTEHDVQPETKPTQHPAVTEVLRFFDFKHLPDHLQEVARPIAACAHVMAETLSGAELTVGLRKLLEAKDCFVRARLVQR